jgi:hypothetical protein
LGWINESKKSDGTRLLLSTTPRKLKRLKPPDWAAVERILDSKVSTAVRVQINNANMYFLRATRDWKNENTILLSEFKPLIRSWTKKTQQLARRLRLEQTDTVRELSRKDLIRRYRDKEERKEFMRRPPLSLLVYAVETSMIAATVIGKECTSPSADVSRNPWILWVGTLGKILKQDGIAISAHSWEKTTREPKFVVVIRKLQGFLGESYPRLTDLSLADGIKKALLVTKPQGVTELLDTLRKWGRE